MVRLHTAVGADARAVSGEVYHTPMLHLRRGSREVVLLEMTDLQPDTFYFIERSEEMTPELWPIVESFIAGGTNAVWADSLNHQAQSVFYRLRY